MAGPSRAPRLSPWVVLVASCAVVVVAGVLVMGGWSLASTHTRQVSYGVQGSLSALTLDLGDADVTVVGDTRRKTVAVQHTDHYGFGHAPVQRRVAAHGALTLHQRCPRTILHGCSSSYRVTVPDNVPVTVHGGDRQVSLRNLHASGTVTTRRGDVIVSGFCGFSLQVRAERGGDIDATTTCPPQQLSVRTTTGSVLAQVPTGRYRIDASTSGSGPHISGVTPDPVAPFSIQALSGSGPVTVGQAP